MEMGRRKEGLSSPSCYIALQIEPKKKKKKMNLTVGMWPLRKMLKSNIPLNIIFYFLFLSKDIKKSHTVVPRQQNKIKVRCIT
jgi:hypothetical protein